MIGDNNYSNDNDYNDYYNHNINLPLAFDEFGIPMSFEGIKQENQNNKNHKNKNQNFTNPFGFTGYQSDNITNLYFAQARYYNPSNSRMLTPDPYWNAGNSIYDDNPQIINDKMVPNIYAIKQSSNLYSYVLNNPLRWLDLSGFVIVLSSNATQEQREQFDRAIEHLNQSQVFRDLFQKLEDATEVFTIDFINDHNMRYNPNTKTIHWNPTSGLVMSDRLSVQSAAIGLAHEMGHIALRLYGIYDFPIDFYTPMPCLDLEQLGLRNNRYTLMEMVTDRRENAILRLYETPIAGQLGEPVREFYLDSRGSIRMNNPIHFRTKNTTRRWWQFWKPRANNHNCE